MKAAESPARQSNGEDAGVNPASPDARAQGRDPAPEPVSKAPSDWSALMARAQDGDGATYRRLLYEITPYVRSLASRRLSDPAGVEDAVQDVLLTIHELRHTYDSSRPFGPWLATIAKRRIIDRFRQEMRSKTREATVDREEETFQADGSNIHDEDPDRHVLRQAVDELPPSQREAIRLLKLEEMSLREASLASGMSIGALKVATHRALRNLKKMFERSDD